MNRIINWLLLVIIFVFDPLAIALVIAANFAFNKLRTHDALNELTKIQEEAGLYDNEGSDIYTKEELSDWDSTLQDSLEDEEWEEKPKVVPVYFDPETNRSYIIEESEEEDKDLLIEEPQIEVKMSGEPSLNILTEEEKQYDLNNDGVLDDQEKAKLSDDKLLNNPGISAWRKKKLRDYLDGNTKSYF
jgi:hypothetical protein